MPDQHQIYAYAVVLAITSLTGLGSFGKASGEIPQANQPVTETQNSSPAELGKKLFRERCSSCHGPNGEKPLQTGLPLRDRKLSDEALAKMVAGRLKNATPEEKNAVN